MDWEEINSKLPFARTKVAAAPYILTFPYHRLSHVQEDYEARKELWEAIDVNGNGFLSLAEVTKVLMSSLSS